ncbi:MAG: hypothetical protein IJ882_02165 [Paludibacteraceae bacterium]|nr:hypothetical protein [Paludibacteraceae bacterium]
MNKQWKIDIAQIYDKFPKALKTYKNKCLMKSVALDSLLLYDIDSGVAQAIEVAEKLVDLDSFPTEESLIALTGALDGYYASRRDDGRWESAVRRGLKDKPMFPVFVLSYGRPAKNATLDRLERWDEEEVYDNTMVFVQPEQEAEYKRNHPKFHFYAKSVSSVGERMLAVLEFCRTYGIRHCIVLEDDIMGFYNVLKGGTSGGGRIANAEEQWGGDYLKYYAYTGLSIMREDRDCVMVGMRNRAMANNESTSLIGYHDPMRGGCPNICYFLDVERFWPIYKSIPKEHYSPQYDWAIQCAVVRARKHWAIITEIVKDEYHSKSVIAFAGDRESLAAEMIAYYGVQDYMSYRRFKDTELQGVKIFYSTRGYDEKRNEKLF